MKRIYLLMIMMIAALGISAQSIQEQEFAKANKYYDENRYDTAVVIYERILADGYESAPLLYNIGNSYFKMRNYPMAILNYEKALKLDPRNEEIRHNLDIANSIINDKINPVPEFLLTKWWRSIGNMFSANGWAVFSLVLFGILLLLIFLYFTARSRFTKKTSFFAAILLLLVLVCSIILAYQKYDYLNTHNEAIITIPTITAKSSPSHTGVDLFVIHEGTKIEILDNTNEWDKIKIADGNIGWLPSSASIKY